MATWNDVKAYIKQNYQTEDFADGLKLVFGIDNQRSQLAFIQPIDSNWITIESPISPIEKVDANKVLKSGILGTAPGGLTVTGPLVMYRCNLYTDSIQGPELVQALELVTLAADNIEKYLGLGDDW